MIEAERLECCGPGSVLRGQLAGRVVSLLDMISEFHIVLIVMAYSDLERELNALLDEPLPWREEFITELEAWAALARRSLEQLEIESSGKMFDMIESYIREGGNEAAIVSAVRDMHVVLTHELKRNKCFMLPSSAWKYWENDAVPRPIRKAVPECVFDLVEANKCFALGRNTASVYHSMRSLECLFPVVAKRLKRLGGSYDPKATLNDNWSKILNDIEKEVRTLQGKRKTAASRKKIEEISNVCARMRSIKDAFRNKAMHAHGPFTEEMASEILSSTLGFIQYAISLLPTKKTA